MTIRIEKTDKANVALYDKVNQMFDSIGSGRNVAETVRLPYVLTSEVAEFADAGLSPADGSLISSGSRSDFVDAIGRLVASNTNSDMFTTEALWQASVSELGFCNQFVYDDVAKTVRLPKIWELERKLIKEYSDDSTWYKIFEERRGSEVKYWCEQGGVEVGTDGSGVKNLTVTFKKPLTEVKGSSCFYYYKQGTGYLLTPTPTITTLSASARSTSGNYDDGDSKFSWGVWGYCEKPEGHIEAQVSYPYLVVGTSVKPASTIEVDEIVTDLNGKADKDLGNVTPSQEFKDMSIGWGMPDYSAGVDKTSGVWHIAPSNGYVYISANTLNNTATLYVINQSTVVWSSLLGGSGGPISTGLIPIPKGLNYSSTGGNSQTLKFYPLKG